MLKKYKITYFVEADEKRYIVSEGNTTLLLEKPQDGDIIPPSDFDTAYRYIAEHPMSMFSLSTTIRKFRIVPAIKCWGSQHNYTFANFAKIHVWKEVKEISVTVQDLLKENVETAAEYIAQTKEHMKISK